MASLSTPSDSPSAKDNPDVPSPQNNDDDTKVEPHVPAPTDVPLPPKPKPLVPLTPFHAPPPKKKVIPSPDIEPVTTNPVEITGITDTTTSDVTPPIIESSSASTEPAAGESPLAEVETSISDATGKDTVKSEASSSTTTSSRKPISNLSKRPAHQKSSEKKKARFRPPPKPGSEYTVPFWSAIPEHAYKLEVLKAGSIRSVLDINLKTHYTFGRLATCDMVMEHQSVSRKHAVIQFRDNSTVYLYDLGSTHGSFINKRRIPPHIYTELKVGDLISFGASTRRYILDGPEALRPQGKRQVPLLLDENNDLTAELPSHFVWQEDEAQGVTWGVGTGVEAAIQKELEQEQERANRTYVKTDALSDRQKKLLERMEIREKKIANIRTEMTNLNAKQEKQNGELTDGQKARIAQCEQIIEKLEEQKESLRDTIHDSFEDAERRSKKKDNGLDDEVVKKKKRKLNDFSDSDEEDEFYDRTQISPLDLLESIITTPAPPPPKEKKDPLTVARAAFKAAQMELDGIESRTFKLTLQLRDFERDARNKEAQDDDALDAFMAGITDVVKKDKRREIEEEVKKMQFKKAQCELDLKQKQAALVQAEYTQAGSLEAAKILREKHEQERKETKKKEEDALIDKTQKAVKTSEPTATLPSAESDIKATDLIDSKSSTASTNAKSASTSEAKELAKVTETSSEDGNEAELSGDNAELAVIRARIETQRKAQREAKKKQAADATLAFVRLGKEKQAEREKAKEDREREEIEKEAAAAAAEKQKIMDALEEEEKRKAVDPLERIRAAFDRKKGSVPAPDDEFSLHAKRKLLQKLTGGEQDGGISAGLHLRKKVKEAPTSEVLEFAPSVALEQKKPVQSTKKHTYTTDSPDDEEVRDVVWVPPVNQRGDGKTHLNAKFGY